MSEENTPQETQQPEATEQQPTMDLDSTIKVDGEEVSVRELINSRDEMAQLKEYNENARLLVSPNAGNTESRENAIRYLMTQEGYSSGDIEEYITWTNQTAEEVNQPEQPQYEQPQYEQPQPDAATQQYYEEQMLRMQEQERARLTELEERQSRISSEMMKKEMDETLKQTFANSDEMKKLMGVGDNSNRESVLHKEVESAMIEGLKRRRQAGENFNKNWFAEEAGKAAKFVYDKFSSVIGDPDKIQRAPETATEDSLFNKPPVDPPKYEKGDSMGDINVKTRDWTLDTLLRGAREGAAGGESKA